MSGRFVLWLDMLLCCELRRRLLTRSCEEYSVLGCRTIQRDVVLLITLLEETAVRRTGNRERHRGNRLHKYVLTAQTLYCRIIFKTRYC